MRTRRARALSRCARLRATDQRRSCRAAAGKLSAHGMPGGVQHKRTTVTSS
jgi:hypothetical protein